jgi:hypothetical protein
MARDLLRPLPSCESVMCDEHELMQSTPAKDVHIAFVKTMFRQILPGLTNLVTNISVEFREAACP